MDPAADEARPLDRLQRARAALDARLAHAPRLAALCHRLLAETLPAGDRIDELQHGALWIGAGAGDPRIALYAAAAWGPLDERWERARRVARALLPDASAAIEAIDLLGRDGELVSVGVEGDDDEARLKLYVRARRPRADREWPLPPSAFEHLAGFVTATLGDEQVRLSALTYCFGFAIGTGHPADWKFDLCAHCLPAPAARWRERLRAAGAPSFDDVIAILGRAWEIALVGTAIDVAGERRFNVYLKPIAR